MVAGKQNELSSSSQFYEDCILAYRHTSSANEECTDQAISLYIMAAWTHLPFSVVQQWPRWVKQKHGLQKTWLRSKSPCHPKIKACLKMLHTYLKLSVACFYRLMVFMSGKMFWMRRLWRNKKLPDGMRQAPWERTRLTESRTSFFSPSCSHPNGMTLQWKIVWKSQSIGNVMFRRFHEH